MDVLLTCRERQYRDHNSCVAIRAPQEYARGPGSKQTLDRGAGRGWKQFILWTFNSSSRQEHYD